MVISATAVTNNVLVTADEIIVETALGGIRYCLPSFSKAVTLTTTGAGGMDTGSAPVSGYVAIYAIWNPTTQTAALLAQNASTLRSNVYTGANMPAGYTASALISVWPTNSGGNLIAGYQVDRNFSFASTNVLSTSTTQASFTSLAMAGVVPPNARSIKGTLNAQLSSAGASLGAAVAASSTGIGGVTIQTSTAAANNSQVVGVFTLDLVTAQTLFYTFQTTGGSGPTLVISVSGYTL
ncbi:phage tail protein [Paraburkholderia hospita]|nr:phage tail protein [Paraburkholderia hospita]